MDLDKRGLFCLTTSGDANPGLLPKAGDPNLALIVKKANFPPWLDFGGSVGFFLFGTGVFVAAFLLTSASSSISPWMSSSIRSSNVMMPDTFSCSKFHTTAMCDLPV